MGLISKEEKYNQHLVDDLKIKKKTLIQSYDLLVGECEKSVIS